MPAKKKSEDPSSAQLSDEYAPLKFDLQQIAERGHDDKDETAPGREISIANFLLESRYGTIVRTDPDTGLPTAMFTSTRADRKGNERTQRFLIGMACEVVTKDAAQQSENVAGRKRVVSEFEATKNAPTLLVNTIEKAQDAGDKVQRKIDEENFEFWACAANRRQIKTASFGQHFDPVSVATFGKLMAIIEQVIEKELGAKLDKCEILCSHFAEVQTYSSADGAAVDSVLPRLAIVCEIKTKSGNTTFGALRGSGGGLEILTKDGDTPEQAVTKLAKRVAQDAIDRDRAQGANILGSECPVILSSHASGVLAHECYGHPCEGDIVCQNRRNKTAKIVLKQRIGAQVSSHRALTLIDSGETHLDLGGKGLRYLWGAIPHDERGQEPKRTILVDGGIQINAMTDERTINEILDGLKPEVAQAISEHGLSGNVRRERYDCPSLVRMRNTYILADPNGPRSLEELAALVPKNKRGVYIKTCAGGWVQPDSGDFCIKGALGFLIENGTITDKPIKDIEVSGNIAKFGDQIKAIGAASTIEATFDGHCGKDDQWVPVSGAGPALYIENAKVGGGSGYRFEELLKDYLKQLEEHRAGRRPKVYLPEVAAEEQNNLCMVAACLPAQDEVNLIVGTRVEKTDYVRSESGELVRQWQTL